MADSELAVDEIWLQAVGFTLREKARATDFGVYESPENDLSCHLNYTDGLDRYGGGMPSQWCYGVYPHSLNLPDLPTRGHVRKLCAALGIPLNETGA